MKKDKSSKKMRKATMKKLRKEIDSIILASRVGADGRPLNAEDLRIESLQKSLKSAMAREGPGARQEAGNISFELARAQLIQAHRRGEI